MDIALEIESKSFLQALRKMPRSEKVFIAECIESDLLSEWDDQENSVETKEKVSSAFKEYENGETISLNELCNAK